MSYSMPVRYQGFGAVDAGLLREILAAPDNFIVNMNGIQVLRPDVQPSVQATLDRGTEISTISSDLDAQIVQITPLGFSAIAGGSDWVSKVVASGQAVLMDKLSIDQVKETAEAALVRDPLIVAALAVEGSPMVWIAGPPDLLAQAQIAMNGEEPGEPGGGGGAGPGPLPPSGSASNGQTTKVPPATPQAKTSELSLNAKIAIGLVAGAAVVYVYRNRSRG